MLARWNFLRYVLAFVAAVLAGCALAQPFAPNANASNAANNAAQANPNVQVSLPSNHRDIGIPASGGAGSAASQPSG